jgi:polygalacturonase
VRIVGCDISSGDDCVTLKSGKYGMGLSHPKPTAHVLIRNCMMRRGHGGVVIGSDTASGVFGVTVENCVMRGTDRGLRVKTRRGRGRRSAVDNIVFSNVLMEGVLTPFAVNMFYFCDPDGKSEYVQSRAMAPVDDRTPSVGSIACRDILCVGAAYAGAYLLGLPESPIRSVALQNVDIRFDPEAGAGVPVMADRVAAASGLKMHAENVAELRLSNVSFSGGRMDAEILGVQSFHACPEI